MIKEDMVKKEDLGQAVKREVEVQLSKGSPMAMAGGRQGGGDLAEKRMLEMVIGGLPKDSPRKEVIEKVRTIMNHAAVMVEDVFTFDKFGSIGIVRFTGADGKKAFKQWLVTEEGKGVMLGAGAGIEPAWAGDNLDKRERDRRRALGKVKKALSQVAGTNFGIDVDYKRGKVYKGKEVVAKFDDDGRLVLDGPANTSRDIIANCLKEISVSVELI